MKTIKVYAPATIANIGCGFDVMGMAFDGIGDVLEISLEEGKGLEIYNKSNVELPQAMEKNVITPAVNSLFKAYGKDVKIKITVLKKILPGSGIGSSAASSAAAVYGVNELLGNPFSREELVSFAMEGEKLISGTAHADNVAPSVLGGIVFIRGYNPLDLIPLPVPSNFWCSVIHPHLTVSTKEARDLLKKELPLRDAVTQWGNVGGFVAGVMQENMPLIGRSINDVVVEPYRKKFIPEYDKLKSEAINKGALAVNISGSGPSVLLFAIVLKKQKRQEK
ncbi:MAG: homoserine kinase [Odoribacter sp.]|nr:homoserine kinase [Odoribacter sp.]